jgi:hypothetical protein
MVQPDDPCLREGLTSQLRAGVAALLKAMQETGSSEVVVVLLARRPATHMALDNPRGVADLLRELREVGALDQVAVLAERAAAHMALDDPGTWGAWDLAAPDRVPQGHQDAQLVRDALDLACRGCAAAFGPAGSPR